MYLNDSLRMSYLLVIIWCCLHCYHLNDWYLSVAVSVISGLATSVSNSYRRHLCRIGVGEGTVDFPPGQCFPLESNLAFLNGGLSNIPASDFHENSSAIVNFPELCVCRLSMNLRTCEGKEHTFFNI